MVVEDRHLPQVNIQQAVEEEDLILDLMVSVVPVS
jgi:hypothetical protein